MGKIKNIAGKVKEAAENSGVLEVYEQGLERTKQYGSMAKLSFEMNSEREELKKVYQEIGRLCYEENKDAPEGFYAPLFSQVEALTGGIEAKRSDIEAIKAELDSSSKGDIDVEISEFENVVNSTESDGIGK